MCGDVTVYVSQAVTQVNSIPNFAEFGTLDGAPIRKEPDSARRFRKEVEDVETKVTDIANDRS